MPKLVVYKRDLKALNDAQTVCRILAAHSPLVELYGETEKLLGQVLELHERPHDENGGEPTEGES